MKINKTIFSKLMILSIILVSLLSLNLSAGEYENTYLDISELRAGANTDFTRPVNNLFDGNKNTHWSSMIGAKENWVELELSDKSLIYGLYLTGKKTADAEIFVEYMKEGVWHPFMAPLINDLDDTLIDLSYDGIVTDTIRLRLRGDNLSTSSFSTVKVLGRIAEQVYHAIEVDSIKASDNTDFVYPAANLLDSNTYTIWKTKVNSNDWRDARVEKIKDDIIEGFDRNRDRTDYNSDNKDGKQAEVLFNFANYYYFDNINIFFTDKAKGNLKVEANLSGKWQQVANIPENKVEGWYRLELTEEIESREIRFLFDGSGDGLGGISVVDFWGRGNYPGKNDKVIILPENQNYNYSKIPFNIEKEEIEDYILEFAVRTDESNELKADINGLELSLTPSFKLREHTIYQTKVNAEILWSGNNYLRLESSTGTLKADNLRLSRINDNKIEHTLDILNKGQLFENSLNQTQITIDLKEEDYQLPEFPAFPEFPSGLPNRGSTVIRNWSNSTVIDSDGYYQRLEIDTDLIFDTSYGDRIIRVDNLNIGPNASISIAGSGTVYLYLENDLDLNNDSRINPDANAKLKLFHRGNRLSFQGGNQEEYKFSGTIYTQANEINIDNGARVNASIYADRADINIRRGIVAKQLIYTQSGNINISDGAKLSGTIYSSGQEIRLRGGSSFQGIEGGIYAPDSNIYLEEGAIIKGEITAEPARVYINHINHQQSQYSIVDSKNRKDVYIEEVIVHSSEDSPQVKLYAKVDNKWISLKKTEVAYKSAIYRGDFQTEQLLIENPAQMAISHLEIKGYTRNNQAAEVKILNPEDHQYFLQNEWQNEKVLGFVDNPSTEVVINGQEVYHRGHYFWTESHRTGLHESNNDITAIAEDISGQINYDSINVYVDHQRLLTLDQNEELIYTEQEIFAISGYINTPLNQLSINGQIVETQGQRFNKELELKDGFNLIEIEGSRIDHNGISEFSRKIYLMVVRQTQDLDFSIESPLDNYYTNQDSIVLSGFITGDSQAKIVINGKEAEIDGIRYRSPAIDLTEGSNTIIVEVVSNRPSIPQQITVIRDSISPQIVDVIPEEGYISNSSIVEISGQIIDKSPVFVAINGDGVNIKDSGFEHQLHFPDGEHLVQLTAIDMAGNHSSHQFNVIVDTTPPLDFEVEIDPAVWTNNTSPIISFETTDETSGISHYELSVNDGEYYEISSPYQLEDLEDGIHDIRVKAVDNAGWETIASTKAYIDTIPPEIPEHLRVIPGDSRMTSKWDPSCDDVIEYRLFREPHWEGVEGEYIVVEGTEYLDLDVENANTYSYRVQAVDRAYNLSGKTEWKQAIVGLAEAEYSREYGSLIEYENVALAIPQEQLPEGIDRITISEIESEVLEDEAINPIIGPIYEFSAYKSGSSQPEENIVMEDGYIGKIKYDIDLIPEGFPEENLAVYYYDTMFGKWFQVPGAGVDKENNEIYFVTNHFSSFSVQATVIQDLTPKEYKDAGYSPFKSYSQHGGITVSPQMGTASTEVTELVLPGKGGFDFVLKRRYDTATARRDAFSIALNVSMGFNIFSPDSGSLEEIYNGFMEEINWANQATGNLISLIEKYLYNQGDFAYSMGQGWRLNIPYVSSANSSMILRTADGQNHFLNEMKLKDFSIDVEGLSRSLEFEQHEGIDFTLYVEQEYSPMDYTQLVGYALNQDESKEFMHFLKSRWYSTGYKLIMKDGTTYEMDELGRTTKMIDPSGLNEINFHYDGIELSYIKDSMDRKIAFDYEKDLLWPRISQIKVEDDPYERVIDYDVKLDNLLHSAYDVTGRESSYKYSPEFMFTGSAGVKINILNILITRLAGDYGGLASSMFGLNDIELFGNFNVQMVFPMKEMTAPGQGTTKLSYEKPTLMYGNIDVNWFLILPESVTFSGNLEQYLLTSRVDVYEDNSRIGRTNYSYDLDYYRWNRPINFQTIEDDGKTRTIYNYKPVAKRRDRWEDRSQSIGGGLDVKFPLKFWQNHVLSILDNIEIEDSQTEELLETQEYEYDIDLMRQTEVKTIRGDSYRQLNYQYDNWGNLVYSRDYSKAHGRENIVENWAVYLNTDSRKDNNLPWRNSPYNQGEVNEDIRNLAVATLTRNYIPKTDGSQETSYLQTYNKYNSIGQLEASSNWKVAADSNWQDGEWLESRFEYHHEHGSITKVIKPEGHIREYEYDNHGLLSKIIERDVEDAQGNKEDIITEIGYEYISGWKLWEKNPRGYVTEYEYDALGRTVRIVQPSDDDDLDWRPDGSTPAFRDDNPVTVIEYNDDQLYSIATNAAGGRTKYDFDDLGRVVEEKKYQRDDYGNYQVAALTKLKYDAWGNIIEI
ncbi:DUF7305 domain-containing protein, partial [Natronospora cellulosivora (SeqCode)]